MTGIVDWAVGHSRTLLSILVVGIVAGLITYITIPKEADPDVPVPMVFVSLSLPGISPEDSERLLLRPMETQLQTIEGVKQMQSYARLGGGGVLLEFDVSFDDEKALADVREKVDIAKADLPDDAEEPQVQEFNASLFPAIIVSLSGNLPERTLYRLARQLQDDIEGLPGVLEAELAGAREELLEVVIDPAALESYKVSQEELVRAVSRNNQLVAAGSLDTGQGRFNIKVPGLFESGEDVLALVVKTSGEGVVTLGDIAQIRRTFVDARGFARINGQPALALEVTKRLGANIIEVTEGVRALVTEQARDWPPTVQVGFINDQSSWIYQSLGSLQAAIVTAISLVMIIVVAALGMRSAMLVGVAIPTSFLLAFLFIGVMGMTINMMIMFGMVIAVGILVDGAIVVTEYADRKMAEGLDRKHAYAQAAKRMFWPIVSSTATTLAAFFPLLFWPGMSGDFMSYLPITVIFVLTAALLVALIFLPVLGSVFGKAEGASGEVAKALAVDREGDVRALKGLTGGYARLVERLIQRPGLVMLGTASLVAAIVAISIVSFRGFEFFVDTEPNNYIAHVSARGNLSAEEGLRLVREVEEFVLGVEGIDYVFTRTSTGGGGAQGMGQSSPRDSIGTLNIELKPYDQRRPATEIERELRAGFAQFAGLRMELQEDEQGPPTGKPVQVELSATSYPLLLENAGRLHNYMSKEVTGLVDIEDSRPLPGIEWELNVDRQQAGRFGADITTIGGTVQLVTNGILIGKYRPDDAEDEVDIRARFPESERGLDQLDRLRVQTASGLVPISNFVTREARPQITQIDRVDGERVVTVRANVAPGVLADTKVREISAALDAGLLDPRVEARFRGADEEQADALAFIPRAFAASLFLMAIILLTQFNNFYHAFLILSSVILSTAGVFLGMTIMGQTFSVIMTGVGVVALAGIVVNNNIILIDTYQRHIREGFEVAEAVVRTAAQRMRPILLTTVTTVCGLLPMVFEVSINYFTREVSIGSQTSKWWVQLATAIVFGLGFSTLVALVLTPCLLYAPTKWGPALARRRRWVGERLARLIGRPEQSGALPAAPERPVSAPPSAPGQVTPQPQPASARGRLDQSAAE